MNAYLLHLSDEEIEVAVRTLTAQGHTWTYAALAAGEKGRYAYAAELGERAAAAERVVIALRTGRHRAIEAGYETSDQDH